MVFFIFTSMPVNKLMALYTILIGKTRDQKSLTMDNASEQTGDKKRYQKHYNMIYENKIINYMRY